MVSSVSQRPDLGFRLKQDDCPAEHTVIKRMHLSGTASDLCHLAAATKTGQALDQAKRIRLVRPQQLARQRIPASYLRRLVPQGQPGAEARLTAFSSRRSRSMTCAQDGGSSKNISRISR